jgi:predicted site-specific integrase-resolvase
MVMRNPRWVSPEGRMSRSEAASRLGIDPGTLFDLAFDGKIQFDLCRNGNGFMYFTEEAIEEYCSAHAPA